LTVSKAEGESLYGGFGGGKQAFAFFNALTPKPGYIARTYAPRSTETADYRTARLFYTAENGAFIDTVRDAVEAGWPGWDLPETDLLFLREYGVRASVDFRGDREVTRQPSALDGIGWIRYFRSPTFNEQVAFGTKRKDGAGPAISSFVDWGQKYAEMADGCRDWVKEALELLGRCDGGVLFHCTTGKDRTGLISALLLGLAGVREDDIVADYCVSEVYLTSVYEELRAEFIRHWPSEAVSLTDPFFRTSPVNMTTLLAHLKSSYGGIRAYLEACGVADTVVERLKSRLAGD
jgi:protein-tyrosine phosphatase